MTQDDDQGYPPYSDNGEDDPEPFDMTFEETGARRGLKLRPERQAVRELRAHMETFGMSGDSAPLVTYLKTLTQSLEKAVEQLTELARNDKTNAAEYVGSANLFSEALDALDMLAEAINENRFDGIHQAIAGFEGTVATIDARVEATPV